MSEGAVPKNWMSTAGGWAIGIGFIIMMVETFTTGESAMGTGCCCLGIFGVIAGGIVSSSGAALSSDGKMVLKQDSTGQWTWMPNTEIPAPVNADPAANYNEQNTQIMSRVIQEIRGGKTLQELETNELDIVASAYGIDSGSSEQKIEALHNSELAKMGLQLGALGVAGGAGAIGAAHIIKSSRERASERAEELREQGRQKLQENIEAGKYNINSKLPTTESGESATDVAHNVILDQLSKQIEEKNLTPEKLMEIGDFNKDGKLDPVEIAGALTAATGFAVPLFIVQDAIKDFDLNQDGNLDMEEMGKLWAKLGFELEEQEFSDEEIDAVLDEVEEETAIQEDQEVVIQEEQESELHTEKEEAAMQEEPEAAMQEEQVPELQAEEEAANQAEPEVAQEVHTDSGDLTEGIDTEFERLVLEMEGARFSSERKTLMERQTTEFLVNLKIQKMERTLIGDPVYRGGQSVHALIDGGPYVGVIKIPVSFDETILAHKEGDEIQVWAKLVDFSPSLKRPVLEASEIN